MDAISLPARIPVKDLLKTHPRYDPAQIQKYNDFYKAGGDFERNKREYMRPRQLDKMPGGEKYVNARLACYHYTPHASGLIDDLSGAAMQAPPRIDVLSPTDARAEYWLGLNKNIDGAGRTITSLCSSRFIQSAVQQRAYIAIDFPDNEVSDNSFGTQRKIGALDARICPLDASVVDDWETDDEGNLDFVRTHTVKCTRATAYGPRTTAVHCWTFYTETAIIEYTASKPIEQTTWEKDAVAVQISNKAHAVGELPVYPCEQVAEFWVMDRLISTAEALFNREGAREYALDAGALNLPVYKGSQNPESIVLSENGCIWVGPDGDFYWRGPDGQVYQALKDSSADLRENLYACIQALAKQAATQKENARQSGVAKMQDRVPMEHLLALLTTPVISAVQRGIDAIAKLRGDEDLEPALHGMDNFDAQQDEIEINKTNVFVSIPGMLPSAKRYANLTLAKHIFPNAPLDEIQTWIDEADTLPLESIDAPPIPSGGFTSVNKAGESLKNNNAGFAKSDTRNPKTGQPAGMEPGKM